MRNVAIALFIILSIFFVTAEQTSAEKTPQYVDGVSQGPNEHYTIYLIGEYPDRLDFNDFLPNQATTIYFEKVSRYTLSLERNTLAIEAQGYMVVWQRESSAGHVLEFDGTNSTSFSIPDSWHTIHIETHKDNQLLSSETYGRVPDQRTGKTRFQLFRKQ